MKIRASARSLHTGAGGWARDLRICRQVEIVLNPIVDALVAVTFHQRFDFTALGFLIEVLDSQRAYLVSVEWKTL